MPSKVAGVATAAALAGLGLFSSTQAWCVGSSSAPTLRATPVAGQQLRFRGGLAAELDHDAVPRTAELRRSGGFAGCYTAAVALLVAVGVRTSHTACRFRKVYGGGPVKKDPAAEFGPQYYGPPIDYGIQRKARLGMPKNGEQRTIPKLAGGSYDRRKCLMKNLTTELIRYGRIKTTKARAMALRSFADRMIVLAKRGDDLSRREAGEWMYDEKLVDSLFSQARERYPDQWKDFTSVTPTMNRKGDWAEMAYIELV